MIGRLSVCMPYWNRQALLDQSLAAYRRLYPGLEISICDDGSTPPVVAPGCIVTSLPVKQLPLSACVPMNAAVRASTRDIICLTNPECEHREDVFSEMLALLTDEGDYVASPVWEVSQNHLLVGPDVLAPHDARWMPKGSLFHYCAVMHRSLFESVGGIDESYRNGWAYEDTDFLWRLFEAGARFKISPTLVYHTNTADKFRYIVKPRSNRHKFEARWQHRFGS